jgi:hypothetical protein
MNSPKRLTASSSSDLSFSIIRDWIEECTTSHDKCKAITPGVSTNFLPPRLIDVGPCDGSRQPYLCVVSEDLNGVQHDLRYVTLSYCWGDRGTFWTTSSNISERKKGIALKDFPATIRDAVLITRQLGIQYLWVDALCIMQGRVDKAAQIDFQQHVAIMGDIYSNAFITVAAAAALHADNGIFHERKLPRYCRIPLTSENHNDFMDLCSDENREYENVHKKEPLYQRSWALQEKVLSRRFVAYETGQIYWRCSEQTVLEDGTGVPQFSDLLSAYAPKSWSSSWRRFVEKYSKTKATFEKDRLPALSGLVKVIQRMNRDEYRGGLSKTTIYDDLIWKTRNPSRARRPSQY